jgi:hypothetical protein
VDDVRLSLVGSRPGLLKSGLSSETDLQRLSCIDTCDLGLAETAVTATICTYFGRATMYRTVSMNC